MDDDANHRTLIRADKRLKCFDNIDFVIFPKFEKNTCEITTRISESMLFRRIINNVRSYKDMYTTYNGICNLVLGVKGAYSMKYSNSESAYQILLSIIS